MVKKDKSQLLLLEIEKLRKIISDFNDSGNNYELMEKALKESEEKYRNLVDSLPFGIIELNRQGIIENVNKSILKILGCKKTDMLNKHFTTVKAIDDKNLTSYFKLFEYALQGDRKLPGEIVFQGDKGKNIYVETRYNLIKSDQKIKNIQVIIDDVSDRREVQKELEYMRFHDQLTGLYNRAYLDSEINRLDTKRQLPLSIIIGDINGLKLVNDAFGDEEGDKLICRIADIFKSVCRSEDIIARYGEDEFAALLTNTDADVVTDVENRIKEKCKKISKDHFHFVMSLGKATKSDSDTKFTDVVTEAQDMLYRNKLVSGKSIPGNAVTALVDSLLGKGHETKEHVKRIEKMAEKMAISMKLPKSQADDLQLLASLHDLGKVAVPDNILKRKKKLSNEDWGVIKSYPEIGYNIAKRSFKFSNIADYILSHHERWDGTGYPRQLSGDDIPLLSRIMAIIDSYDIMRSGRFYKKTLTKKEAISELRSCSGKQFDPKLVEQFVGIIGED